MVRGGSTKSGEQTTLFDVKANSEFSFLRNCNQFITSRPMIRQASKSIGTYGSLTSAKRVSGSHSLPKMFARSSGGNESIEPRPGSGGQSTPRTWKPGGRYPISGRNAAMNSDTDNSAGQKPGLPFTGPVVRQIVEELFQKQVQWKTSDLFEQVIRLHKERGGIVSPN